MFCLFKNSRIAFPINYLVLLISLGGTGYWLYFAFVEKAFLEIMFAGKALFVDLLLGLPVVLIFAVVVYAMIFWLLKVALILVLPQYIIPITPPESELSDELDPALGNDYWDKENPPESNEEPKQPQDSQDKHER